MNYPPTDAMERLQRAILQTELDMLHGYGSRWSTFDKQWVVDDGAC